MTITPEIRSSGSGHYHPVIICTAIVVVFLGSHIARTTLNPSPTPIPSAGKAKYHRIVALSPSTVEILYRIGLEDRLVGVPRYANYPPEAKNKPCVGGYLDLNREKLLRLDPDCVILLKEQTPLANNLEQLGIHTITVDHNNTSGIIDSLHTIGNELGQQHQAKKLISELETRIQQLTSPYQNLPTKPRVLICISRDTTATHPDQLIIAGNAGFHRELVHMLGGTNAYRGPIAFPRMSREQLIETNPDVIIDLITTEAWNDAGEQQLLAQWNAFSELDAVKNQRVAIIHGDQHLIPGPRFPETLEQFAHAIHPPVIPHP